MSTSRQLWLLLPLLVMTNVVHALDGGRFISQYGHTAWRLHDGELPAPVYPIEQTNDGYLWLGTQAGLVRFDGIRFVPFSDAGGRQLPGKFITSLLRAHDGSLWIGSTIGLSHWNGESLTNYLEIRQGVSAIAEDLDGTIWFANSTPSPSVKPLCRMTSAASPQCFGIEDGLDFAKIGCCIRSLVQDTEGSFLMGTQVGVLRWKPGTRSQLIVNQEKAKSGEPSTLVLATSKGGQVWAGVNSHGSNLGLQQLVDTQLKTYTTQHFDGSALAVQAMFFDRENSLWIGTLDQGIFRLQGDSVENFQTKDGLSGDSIYWFYEDDEGSLWVATSEGIDRFRDLRVTTLSKREGLGVSEPNSILAARDGSIWIGGAETLDIIRSGAISSLRSGAALPGHQVTAMFEDHAGQIWIGIDRTLFIYENGTFTPVPGSNGQPVGFVVAIAEDSENDLWVATKDNLMRIRERVVRDVVAIPGHGVLARSLASDPTGGIWIGLVDGTLAHYKRGDIKTFDFESDNGPVKQLAVRADNTVWGATPAGVVAARGESRQRLTTRNGLPCDDINAVVAGAEKTLWLYTQCGLVSISESDLEVWWKHSEVDVHPRIYDALDGVRPGRSHFGGAASSPDGRLWFVNTVNVQTLDTSQVQHGGELRVQIEEVVADRKAYRPSAPKLQLAANTHDIQINYTAASLATPQKVHFRHKLEGRDLDWQDSGSRRQAIYTDLAPGDYRFRVVASRDSDTWSDAGAQLSFNVAAAWYQTALFKVVSILIVLSIAIVAYRWRVRRIAKAMRSGFYERLAERNRLAREIHDTLLQTIQASKMVAEYAVDSEPEGMRRELRRLASWMERAIQECRAALNALRLSNTRNSSLAQRLKTTSETCLVSSAIQFDIAVEGEARALHPIVSEEICYIGHEAIRNACLHSKGTRLDVSLTYGRDFVLRIADNGVGIDPAQLTGRDGHFGLTGMRERAHQIHGRLSIASDPKSGTTITLVVPGEIVYDRFSGDDTPLEMGVYALTQQP